MPIRRAASAFVNPRASIARSNLSPHWRLHRSSESIAGSCPICGNLALEPPSKQKELANLECHSYYGRMTVSEIIRTLGGPEKAAERFSVDLSAIYQWQRNGIPAGRWLTVSDVSGIPLDDVAKSVPAPRKRRGA